MEDMMKRISIAMLIALVGFPQMSETIYTPALPNVAASLGISAHLAESTLAIYFVGFALGVLSWGIISDYCGRRAAMLAGLAIYAIGNIGCGMADSGYMLLSMRMVQAFGASVGSVITQTMIRDLYEGSERIQLFSIISGALAFSPAIGPLVGGFVSEWYGWRANFSLLNLLAMGLLLWSWHSLPETRAVHVPQLTWREILKLNRSMVSSAAFWGHVILIGTTNGILFSFYEEAPFVFIEKLGIAPSIYGCLGMLIAGSSLLAAHLSYRLSLQKIAPEATIRRGACCAIAGSALWLAIAAAGELQSGSLGFVAALAGMALLFLGVGLIIPNSLSLALRPFQAIGGTAGSLFGGYYYVLIAFFTWAMGWFHNGSACPLPGYLLALSILALCGSQLARRSATASLCSEPKSVT